MKIQFLTFIFFSTAFFTYAQNTVYVGPRGNTASDPANGTYVSPSGNDQTGNGSIERPYKSINFAIGKVSSGATIILRGGTYREGRRVRINKSNITIKSAKGEWAVIDLTTYDAGNNQHSAVEFYAEDQVAGGVVKGGKLQGVEVKGGFYAVCFETQWDWGKGERGGASNIIVEDCNLHHSFNDVVKVKPGCDNITIRYNEIHNSGQDYIKYDNFTTGQRNSEGIDNVNGDKMHVHNNYIHDICSNGIYAKGGAIDAIIEYNIVERTYAAGICLGFDTSPEFFDLTVNPSYYENIKGIARYNLVKDTGWEGIGLYASKDVQVYNNTIINAQGFGTSTSAGIVRSPIYFGIATQDEMNPKGCPANINPNIHHNISVQPNTFNNRMIEIRYATINVQTSKGPPPQYAPMTISGLSGNPTMNNNCYYVAGKSAIFRDNRPTSSLRDGTLATWKTHISGDAGSIEVNPSLNADFMPSNAQCAGMGITAPLKLNVPTNTDAPKALSPETQTSITNGTLCIDNPVAEKVQGYSIAGKCLFDFQKPEGKACFVIHQPKGALLLLTGSSGWTKKLIVQ